jgi:hypothetical protein
MKGKFKLFGHIGLALFLVSVMVLSLAPVAQAATAVTDVWVQFTTSTYNKTNTASDFTIHFTPTTSMERGVDTITVWFPDGSTAMGPDNFSLSSGDTTASYYDVDRDGEAITYSAVDVTKAATLSTTGYRITVVTPVDLDAGTPCSLRVEAAAGVACADSTSHNQYYIKAYTSQDTTPVLSDAFDIDATGPNAVSLALSPDTAGAAGQYTFTVDLTGKTELTASAEDTLTFIFPYGTTIPSSIAADKISFSTDAGSSWSTGTTDATVNQKARMVTVTTPITLGTDDENRVRFSTGAGILNPQTVKTSPYYTDCFGYTSQDELQVAESSGYNVTAGTATKLGFNNDAYPASSYSDSATMINMYSDVLYVELQDQYGNLKHISGTEPTVSFSSSSGTGTFYESGPTQISTKLLVDGKASIYYRDSTAGTPTLTASATGYTDGTWSINVVPGVSLYDSNDNLIKTYAPTSTSPATESTTVHSGDYIQNAINASLQGDKVKLGDGTYELDSCISLNKKVTLTSENGASSTTIVPASEPLNSPYNSASDVAVHVGVSGTAAYPVVIDGLTFDRLRLASEFDQAIYNNGYNYVTVQNCTFNYIIPAYCADSEYGNVVMFMVHTQENADAAAITSATVSNNTFNNCCPFAAPSGGEAAVINMIPKATASDKPITGAVISGNTLTDCNGLGISLNGYVTTGYVTANVTDNTLTNPVQGLSVQRYTTSCNILRNTVTGAYTAGLYIETTDHNSLVVKNNSFTDCAGADKSYFSSGGVVVLDADAGGSGTDPVINYNDIYNNDAEYSIYVGTSGLGAQDCKYNYFGDATGPYYSALTGATVSKSNTGGAGKKVSDQVTYYPWLHKSKADVVTDNASYQACTMALVAGWNTLSTPVKLVSTADSIDELIPSGMTIGYYYDSGWQQITTGYVLSPCDAVYVKMGAATDVLLKFDAGAFTTPSKALSAGWNLCSMAALDSDGKYDKQVAASVYRTADNLPGYSLVVSPSLNAVQTDMYYNPGTSWSYSVDETTDAGTNTVYTGLGYWIYMQNAATFAGFEITPIVPDLD